jgi:hypothetical protein
VDVGEKRKLGEIDFESNDNIGFTFLAQFSPIRSKGNAELPKSLPK